MATATSSKPIFPPRLEEIKATMENCRDADCLFVNKDIYLRDVEELIAALNYSLRKLDKPEREHR